MVQIEKVVKQFSQIPVDSDMADQSQNATYTLPDNNTITINRSQIVDPFVNYRQFWNKYLKDATSLPSYVDESFLKGVLNYRGLEQLIYDTIDEYFALLENKNKTIVPSVQNLQAGKKKPNQLTYQDLLNNVILTGGNLSFWDTAWKIAQGIQKKGGNVVKCPIEFNKDQ